MMACPFCCGVTCEVCLLEAFRTRCVIQFFPPQVVLPVRLARSQRLSTLQNRRLAQFGCCEVGPWPRGSLRPAALHTIPPWFLPRISRCEFPECFRLRFCRSLANDTPGV